MDLVIYLPFASTKQQESDEVIKSNRHKKAISRNCVIGISTRLHVLKATFIDRESQPQSLIPTMSVSIMSLIKHTAILQARLFLVLPPNPKSMATKEVRTLADAIC